MRPRIHVITIAVKDLKESVAFFRDGLGWPCWALPEDDETSSLGEDVDHVGFELQNGFSFVLYERSALLKEAKELQMRRGSSEFILSIACDSEDELHQLFDKAAGAGGIIVNPPMDQPWGGVSGSFRDLDHHLWEVMWIPDPADSEHAE